MTTELRCSPSFAAIKGAHYRRRVVGISRARPGGLSMVGGGSKMATTATRVFNLALGWRRAAVFVLVLSQSRCADRVESTGRFGRRDLRGTSSQIFPPDFPPNSPLQGGKWRYRTVGGEARKPYFSNKTELDVTGQNGPQGFRKPLLYPTELRDHPICGDPDRSAALRAHPGEQGDHLKSGLARTFENELVGGEQLVAFQPARILRHPDDGSFRRPRIAMIVAIVVFNDSGEGAFQHPEREHIVHLEAPVPRVLHHQIASVRQADTAHRRHARLALEIQCHHQRVRRGPDRLQTRRVER